LILKAYKNFFKIVAQYLFGKDKLKKLLKF